MNSKVRTIIFTAICLMMAIPAKMTAQDVVVTDLPLLHEMIEGREVRARYIFLENFAYGDKGTELFDKADQIAREYVFKKPLSYDPQKIPDEFRKYAIGRRSWLDVIILENGRYAVRTSKGCGVMGIDGPDLFYKPVSDACYVINAIDCYDENDEYYPIFSVMDENLRYGVIDRSRINWCIHVKRIEGRQFHCSLKVPSIQYSRFHDRYAERSALKSSS